MSFSLLYKTVCQRYYGYILLSVLLVGQGAFYDIPVFGDNASQDNLQITNCSMWIHVAHSNISDIQIKPSRVSLYQCPFSTDVTCQCLNRKLRYFHAFRVKLIGISSPVHVFQTSGKDVTTEGYLAISGHHLGSEYVISTFCPKGSVCGFAVAPLMNWTSVCIQIPVTVNFANIQVKCPRQVNKEPLGMWKTITCNLMKFETLYVEHDMDLSGIRVTADGTVSVVVRAVNVTSRYTNMSSTIIEQLPPVNKWGTQFVVVTSGGALSGDVIKLTTQRKNTTIYMTGLSPFVIPHYGQSVVKKVYRDAKTYIKANKPILILQIFGTTLIGNTDNSTLPMYPPSMIVVPAVNQWKYTVIDPCKTFTNCTMAGAEKESSNELVNEVQYSHGDITDVCNTTGMAYILCSTGEAFLLGADWSNESEVRRTKYFI